MIASAVTAVPGRSRRGMTLVELLIVVLLLAGFMALVIAGVRGSQAPQLRQAAEQLASALRSAQSCALGVPEGAGTIVTIMPGSTSIYDAVMHPLIEATVTGSLTTPAGVSTLVNVAPTNANDVTRAYKILLTGTGNPWVAPPAAWMDFTAPGTVSFRSGTSGVGQTAANTVWPKVLSSGTCDALLGQCPSKSSAVLGLGSTVTIDPQWSGVGDEFPLLVGTTPQWISISFDRVGRVGEVLACGADPDTPPNPKPVSVRTTGTIYLLVTSAASDPLASDESLWVAISPQTGRVIVADNVPQSGTDVRAARQNARQGITAKR